jgi:hypothetical protein
LGSFIQDIGYVIKFIKRIGIICTVKLKGDISVEILEIILGLVTICLGLGFVFLAIYEVDEVDKIIIECINGADDTELDGWVW